MPKLSEAIRARLERLAPQARFFLQKLNILEALERYRYRTRHALALPIPPRRLRTLVGPEPTIEGFLAQGQRMAGDIRNAVAAVGRTLESFRNVLDFGCGCGRQIRWFADLSGSCRLHGSDVCAPAIRWNQRHLGFAEFAVNGPLPPLPYPDAKFDLVYSISVFTHLNGEAQEPWLAELERVASPGGLVLISVQGELGFESFKNGALPTTPDLLERLKRHGPLAQEGFIFEPYKVGGDYGLAFHDIGYIRDRWCRRLRLAKFIARGIDGWQDLVVLEKPA